MTKTKIDITKLPTLPTGLKATDFKQPKWPSYVGPKASPERRKKYKADEKAYQIEYPSYGKNDFELWYSEGFGWCIPTLLISKSRRVSSSYSGGERTYATRVSNRETVSIGNGPHVKHRIKVYVRTSRLKDLQKYLDMRGKGAEDANSIRDRISTRRARGTMNRWW